MIASNKVQEFSRRIEFSDLIRHYFPFPLDHAMMLIYHVPWLS